MTQSIKDLSIEEKEEFIKNKIQEGEENCKKQERIAVKKIVAILKNEKFSFVQIQWVLHHVLEEIRNIPLNFE